VFNYNGIFKATFLQGTVDIYTDGAAGIDHFDLEHNRFEWSSAYAVVPMNLWLAENFERLPNEAKLSDQDLLHINAAAFGMKDNCQNQAAYYTELAAIARAIMAVPEAVNINLYTDSKSSIEAIQRYREEINDRRKLRVAGRPFLGLIELLMNSRTGNVFFHHVHSHTDFKDRHSSGNKVADHVAGSVLRQKSKKQESQWAQKNFRPLPLHLGERHVVLRDHVGRIIAGDIRRTAQREAQARMVSQWRESKSQGSFAGPFYREIREILFILPSRLPMNFDSRQLLEMQRFLLQAATNTIQYQVRIVNSKRVPFEALCARCNVVRDTWHMFVCPALEPHHQQTAKSICSVMDQLWQESHPDQPPRQHPMVQSLVVLVGWLMHRDLENKQDLHRLQRLPDVIRACFGGFLVWEMKAELRKFAGIGRRCDSDSDVKSVDPERFQHIDSLVESAIKNIRAILFLGAFNMSSLR